jgi:tripartite-type tricarboxylate transporter receptor subunit TctC
MARQTDIAIRTTRRQALKGLIAGAAAGVAAPIRSARAAWPVDKPIRLVVPFAPAGPADVGARIVAQGLTEVMAGTTVIVENKAGAGGNIGMGQVARAEPDGYTLVVTSSALMLNPSLYDSVPYDPIKDFEPISQMLVSPNVIVADARTGIKTLAELVARAKAEPDRMTHTSAGIGTTPHLTYELLKIRAGLKMPHMAVTGAGPAIQAILAGTVQSGCTALPAAHAHIQSGALVGLGLTAHKRWHDLPDVPTMQEAGFDDFLLDTKIILLAPARTPKEIVEQLAREINGYLNRSTTRANAQKIGFDVLAGGPDVLRAAIAKEVPMWKDIVTQAGVRLK